jgi:hypothetical protein
VFRRTPLERADQRISWERHDQAFFAAGACHVLAWTCRESYPSQPIRLTALNVVGTRRVFHVYAAWNEWAFDHCGWSLEAQLMTVNEDFEGQPLGQVPIGTDLAAFCEEHRHRMPEQYWRNPLRRAHEYVARYSPPWAVGSPTV